MGTSLKKPVKQKKCKQCKELYTPRSTTQQACSGKCAIELVKAKSERKFKSRNRKLKREFNDKDRNYQRQRAQYWFNRYIRLRDAELPCISCGRDTGAKVNAGHWKSRGAHPQHAFNEDNCSKQCEYCNTYLSGNVAEYRKNLILRIGLERVEAIENDNASRKYKIEDFKAIQERYKDKCKELEQGEALK